MRITESRMLELAATSVSDARDRAAQAQGVLSSGVRVARPSDDPAAWAEGERAAVRKAMSSDRGQAIGMAVDSLQQTDGALNTVSTGMTQLAALAIQGANGSLGASDRQGLAAQVRALRDSSLAALNQKGPDGSYLLGGSNGSLAPFPSAGVYQGDGTARAVAVGEEATAPGAVTGEDLTTANGGVDVMSIFDQAATLLDANDTSGLQALMPSIQTAIGQVAGLRSLVGERLSALQSADDARQSFEERLADQHAHAVEADPVAAASELTRASTVLESARAAAQQIVAMLSSR